MRSLVFLFFCVALAAGSLIQRQHEVKHADKEHLQKQKDIFELLYHVHQPNPHQEQVTLGKTYEIESHLDQYEETQLVKQYLMKYKTNKLPQGKIFSVLYDTHMTEAEHLFKIFYYAKNYDTFYKTACWAREHVNEQIFVYALSVAVLHRPDTQGIILPPPYEIYPYLFISDDAIHKAYLVKMQGHGEHIAPNVFTENNEVIIKNNYTGWYVHYNEEQKMSYLTEDIAWNTLYYYYHLDYPFWMNGEEFGLTKDSRGERFYYIHQQILARYYLERLSNGLGEIPTFSWMWPVKTGYYPSLQYHNGMKFPVRPNYFHLHQDEFLPHLIQVQDYERRIRQSIDHGYLLTEEHKQLNMRDPESLKYLASIVEGNDDCPNPRYYRNSLTIAKMLLGNSVKPINQHHVVPSVLDHYQTCLRDPMFYQLQKRYMGYFLQFQNLLKPYTKEEVHCPEVVIKNVDVEKLVTYFEDYDVDMTNVVYQTKEETEKLEDDLVIKARQYRLNNLPFTVTTNVVAEKPMKVLVKFFLGPKYDSLGHEISLEENRVNFVQLDQFVYDLKSGKNLIQRNSKDFMWSIKDFTPSRQIYHELKKALKGTTQFPLDMSEAHNGIPSRLILPRGRNGGMPYVFYCVIVPHIPPITPYGTGYDHVISSGIGSGARRIDGHPLGYPFDRPIDETNFVTPNMHFEDVLVFHKKKSEINQSTL